MKKHIIYKRFCPSCDVELSDNAQICPSCEKSLFETKHTPMYAGLMGYLWGGLIGSIALGVVKFVEYLIGFSDRILEMIVFGIFAVSSWKLKKSQLLKPKDLAKIKQFEIQETVLSKEDYSITEENIDGVVGKLKKRKLKPSNHFTIIGILLVVIIGTSLIVIASNLVSSGSTESFVADMHKSLENMKNEKGPFAFIIRTVAHFVGIFKPFLPILIPGLWTMFLVLISGLIVSIITYFTDFRNIKILLIIVMVQAIIGGGLFDINHFALIINKDWTFWTTIILIPLAFIFFYYSSAYSITKSFAYCSVCGGKLSKTVNAFISNESELALLKLLINNKAEFIDHIEPINQDKYKEHIKIDIDMCPKQHDHNECKITVWRINRKSFNKSEETTESTDLWFSTVLSFEIGREIVNRLKPKIETA